MTISEGSLQLVVLDPFNKSIGLGIMRAFYLLLLTVLLMSMAALALVAGCEQTRGSIEGLITDESGQPVSGAWVFAPSGVSPGVIISTDEDGYYILKNIPTGNWEIEFYTKYGWGVGLESVTVRSGETTRLDFTIGAKPPPDPPRIIIPPY